MQEDARPVQTVREEIYENERRLSSEHAWSCDALLPLDVASYTDPSGQPVDPRNDRLPSCDWHWANRWQIQRGEGLDVEGWCYAASWPTEGGLFSSFQSKWELPCRPHHLVRRRKLMRERHRLRIPKLALQLVEDESTPSSRNVPNMSTCQKFEMSPPLFLSECHDTSAHLLMLGCCDDYGHEQNMQLVPVSHGEVVGEHLELTGVPGHSSVAPLHEVTYSVRRSADNSRTSIVTIMPRYVIVNILPWPIFVSQQDAPTVLVIPPGERECLWWWADSRDRRICILPDNECDNWTSAFEILGAETRLLHVRDRLNKLHIFQACVTEGVSTVLTICEELCPPVRIDNRSSYALAIGEPTLRAAGADTSPAATSAELVEAQFQDCVQPLSTFEYCFVGSQCDLALTIIGLETLSSPTLNVKLLQDGSPLVGPAGSMPIEDIDGDTVAYLDIVLLRAGPQTVLAVEQRMADSPSPIPQAAAPLRQLFELEIMLVGAGVSIVDTQRRCEVLHLCLSGARYWASQWAPELDMPKVITSSMGTK